MAAMAVMAPIWTAMRSAVSASAEGVVSKHGVDLFGLGGGLDPAYSDYSYSANYHAQVWFR